MDSISCKSCGDHLNFIGEYEGDLMMETLRWLWYLSLGRLATLSIFRSIHIAIYILTGGKLFGRMFGCTVVLLTTKGRKTGIDRTVPIFGFIEGKTIVVVASNGGKQNNPAWYSNLMENPEARVLVGKEVHWIRARTANPNERNYLWPHLVSYYGGYEIYKTQAKNRQIPVLLLEPRYL